MKVPLIDLQAQTAEIRPRLDEAVRRVFDNCSFVLGPEVQKFESAMASLSGTKHAVGVNSGTDALLLALETVRDDRGPGKVVTSPFSFFATVEAIVLAGLTPVFADIEAASFNLDPQAALDAVDGATVALLPVHLFGACADIDRLKEPGIDVIEDAAQAIGATYKERPAGSLGRAGCFSFYVTKNLGAAGDAGAVTTSDDAFERSVRQRRAHSEMRVAGDDRTYHHVGIGRNSRLDALQAAVLRAKLDSFADWQARRERNAAYYGEALHDLDAVQTPAPSAFGRHAYHQYVIRAQRRDELTDHLTQAGVGTRIFYPIPLHLQPAMADMGLREGAFPVAEQAAHEVISIPVHPQLSDEQREYVVATIRAFYGA